MKKIPEWKECRTYGEGKMCLQGIDMKFDKRKRLCIPHFTDKLSKRLWSCIKGKVYYVTASSLSNSTVPEDAKFIENLLVKHEKSYEFFAELVVRSLKCEENAIVRITFFGSISYTNLEEKDLTEFGYARWDHTSASVFKDSNGETFAIITSTPLGPVVWLNGK